MASIHLNKIVHSNVNFKPWMLSKNTNELVKTYIQKVYKQMPTSFRRDTKTAKVATLRPENRGPLSTLKNLERQLPLATITPRATPSKKLNSKLKQPGNCWVGPLKYSAANSSPSKRVFKTPSYKIYKSQRYGSSSSSSHSSLLKRCFDDRIRQRQRTSAQISYLTRSFHTSHFEPTYARYLTPARNQQVEANFGSIPDAVKFSSNIIKDLMAIDNFTRSKIASRKNELRSTEPSPSHWTCRGPLDKYSPLNPKNSAIKNVKLSVERNMRKAKLSPEHRDYARINVSRVAQLRHPKPPNELFTAQHDRNNTELHEKHKRNRMQKLGLVPSSSATEREKQIEVVPVQTNHENHKAVPAKSVMRHEIKSVPALSNQPAKTSLGSLPLTLAEISERKPSDLVPVQDLTSAVAPAIGHNGRFADIPKGYTKMSPIAAARAQMPDKDNVRSYRYNRFDFFSTKKY